MIKLSKICFVISGCTLIFDSILMILGKPNPIGLPLPCPITLIILAVGLISFGLAKSE
ncbi:MAG: hypothetical protein SV062_01830 [Thermodesulfobacteriota bacterium]|nr:hypothetical protein [Thermodesulfobacteriota bacterium]